MAWKLSLLDTNNTHLQGTKGTKLMGTAIRTTAISPDDNLASLLILVPFYFYRVCALPFCFAFATAR